jgi:hypothetical protein
MSFQLNGQVIRPGKSFVDADGVIYPTNWNRVFTQEQKDAIGIVWVPDPAPVDTRFYWDHDLPKRLEDEPAVDENDEPVLDEDGVQVINTGLKTQWIKQQKEIAGSLLERSDWYVTRKAEAGTEIPADVATYRTAVRTVSGQRETEISEAATFEAFVALVDNQPKVWDEETETMVDNTEPFLTPWPEEQ